HARCRSPHSFPTHALPIWQYMLSDRWTMRSRLELSHYRKEGEATELGLMAYHDVIYKPLNGRLSGNMRLAVFGTPGYNSRMYARSEEHTSELQSREKLVCR